MFRHYPLLLGPGHRTDPDAEDVAPCGGACPHRLASITCPFFPGVPCLVGCRIKQVLNGSGLQYAEYDLFVVAQAGRHLIGETVILDLYNPAASHMRILTNKRGAPVFQSGGENLLDIEPAANLPGQEE